MMTRGSNQTDSQFSDSQRRFPDEAEVQQIAFVPKSGNAAKPIFEFPAPISVQAVLAGEANDSASMPKPPSDNSPTNHRLSLLLIPADAGDLAGEDLLANVEGWVIGEEAHSEQEQLGQQIGNSVFPPVLMMTLQGAKVFWRNGRAAVLAHPDRMENVRLAVVESAFYELEVSAIERSIGENWPQLESDLPQAFSIDDFNVGKQNEFALRYRQSMVLQARLARIGPAVHSPHVYPATLASQMAERFRDRTRLTHRHEFLQEQIEIFERVYESCAQRSSDYVLARKGHILEWIIIILLLIQILFYAFEILTDASPATETIESTMVIGFIDSGFSLPPFQSKSV
jgi:hypothetical protein